ncbi:MAG: pilus assembly protein, partial [Planctomycetes bacterium]|nr:pilus assembly protein [Planctomycetota bacterium]
MKTTGAKRRGAAALEFAAVAPVILLMFFAAFEFSRLNMIRHTTEVAAFEGARRGILPGATTAAVRKRVGEVLGAIGAQAETINIEPAVLTRSADKITVEVTV